VRGGFCESSEFKKQQEVEGEIGTDNVHPTQVYFIFFYLRPCLLFSSVDAVFVIFFC
jgi:hypothetical protein